MIDEKNSGVHAGSEVEGNKEISSSNGAEHHDTHSRRTALKKKAENIFLDVKNKITRERTHADEGEWKRSARELLLPRLPSLSLTYSVLQEASDLVRGGWKTKSTIQLHKTLLGTWQQMILKRQLRRNETHQRNNEYDKIVNPVTEGMQAYMAAGNESLLDSTNHAEVAEVDDNKRNDVDRTAALIYAVGQVRDEVLEERWPVEKSRGLPVEMRGYKRLFSKREPGAKADFLIDVIQSSHVTVIIDGIFFRLNLINSKGRYLNPDEIRNNLLQMRQEAQAKKRAAEEEENEVFDPGYVTTLNRREWHRVKADLRKDKSSRESLLDIDNALMTFVMDTQLRPVTLEERSSLALYGKYYRRDIQTGKPREYVGSGGWYDGPCIRTTGNGMTSGNFEHLGGDGSETMTFFDRLLEVSEQVTFDKSNKTQTNSYRQLELNVPGEVMHEAYNAYSQETEQQKVGVVMALKEQGVTYSDSLVQIALFLTQYDISDKKSGYFIEPVNLRAFMDGRIGYGLINMAAIHRYADWVMDHKVLYDTGTVNEDTQEMRAIKTKGAHLLQEAIASHKRMLAMTKEGESPLNHLTTLTGAVHTDVQEKGAFVRDIEAVFTRIDEQVRDMMRANITTNGGSKDRISSFMTIGTKNESGTGIGYSIQDEAIIFSNRAKGDAIRQMPQFHDTIPYYLDYVVRDLKLIQDEKQP